MKTYDFILPIGENCRPAGNLRDFEVRKQYLPFDWKVFSLPAFLHVMETGFEDYFAEIRLLAEEGISATGHFFVRDIKNDILSMHDFRTNADLEKERLRMRQRDIAASKRIEEGMRSAKQVLLVSSRTEFMDELTAFLTQFSKMYPDANMTMVNIRHQEDLDFGIYTENGSWSNGMLSLDDYAVNEITPGETFLTSTWKGNQGQWAAILGRYIPVHVPQQLRRDHPGE